VPKELVTAIADMEEDAALAMVGRLLAEGTNPQEILDDCRAAMDVVGSRFEEGEYFLPELMLAGDLLEQISVIVKPLLVSGIGGEVETLGTVLIARSTATSTTLGRTS